MVQADIEEVAEVVREGLILVEQLLAIPDRAIELHRAVEARTPGTVLNEGLLTVPALTEVILHDRKEGNLTGFDTTTIFDSKVAVRTALSLTGGDDDDTVRSAGTVKSGSGCTL